MVAACFGWCLNAFVPLLKAERNTVTCHLLHQVHSYEILSLSAWLHSFGLMTMF